MKAFSDTTVPVSRTQEAINKLLEKHDVEVHRWTMLPDGVVLEFKLSAGAFALRLDYALGDARSEDARRRQVMRALHWHLKARFDAIDFGIEDTVRAFLPYLITGPNRTLGEDVIDAMEQRKLGIDIPLLPEGRT